MYVSAKLTELSKTPSVSLCKRVVTIVASTSMEEGSQVSQPVDCTLLEFMAMANELKSSQGLSSELHPREQMTRFPDASSEDELAICFPT